MPQTKDDAIAGVADQLRQVNLAEEKVDLERRKLGAIAARVMRQHNLSYRDLAGPLGVAHTTVIDWIRRGR